MYLPPSLRPYLPPSSLEISYLSLQLSWDYGKGEREHLLIAGDLEEVYQHMYNTPYYVCITMYS